MFYTDVLPNVEEGARTFIMANDRMLFAEVFRAVEEYAAANDVLYGGNVGMDLLTHTPINPGSFQLELYADKVNKVARDLGAAILASHSMHVNLTTTTLKISVDDAEVSIFVDTRELFKIHKLGEYRGVNLAKVMRPSSATGYFTGKTVKCISEELQLIDVYRSLYNPMRNGDWEDLIVKEKALFTNMVDIFGRTGASDMPDIAERSPREINTIILHRYLRKSSEFILVGDYAIRTRGQQIRAERMQVLTRMSADDIDTTLGRCLGTKITHNNYWLNIPSDFQIMKTSHYIGKKPIMDSYNSLTYEIVPFDVLDHIRVAGWFVILRWLFIDIWNLQTTRAFSKDIERLDQRINTIIANMQSVRARVSKMIEEDKLDALFPRANYEGIIVPAKIAQKRLLAKTRGAPELIFVAKK